MQAFEVFTFEMRQAAWVVPRLAETLEELCADTCLRGGLEHCLAEAGFVEVLGTREREEFAPGPQQLQRLNLEPI